MEIRKESLRKWIGRGWNKGQGEIWMDCHAYTKESEKSSFKGNCLGLNLHCILNPPTKQNHHPLPFAHLIKL